MAAICHLRFVGRWAPMGPPTMTTWRSLSLSLSLSRACTHTHTHTHTRLTALFPGLPRWAATRKVKPIWILLKQETVGGSGISWSMVHDDHLAVSLSLVAPDRQPRQHPTTQFFYRLDALPSFLGGLYRCAKFGWNLCSSFNNVKLSIFCPFGLKTPIHAPQNWGFGGISPQNGEQYQQNRQKAYPCASLRHLNHQAWKSVDGSDL